MKKNNLILSLAFTAIAGITLVSCEKETILPMVKNNVTANSNLSASPGKIAASDQQDPATGENKFVLMREKKKITPMEQPKAGDLSASMPLEEKK